MTLTREATAMRDVGALVAGSWDAEVADVAPAEYEQARHDHALNTIGFTFGWVNTVDEIIEGWRS